MPGPLTTRALGRARLLGKLPVARVIAVAELVVLAREHMRRLEPHERRRLIELVRLGRARPSSLSARERRELSSLLAKIEPRVFATRAVEKIAGVPLWSKDRGRR